MYLWFTSVLPVLQALEGMSFVKHTRHELSECAPTGTSEVVAQPCKDGSTQLVLAISMAAFLLCLHGMRVLWPKGFKGKLP